MSMSCLKNIYQSSDFILAQLQFQGTRDVFYVCREVDIMKTTKVNVYIMHIFKRLSFYLDMQPKIISKCITSMTS